MLAAGAGGHTVHHHRITEGRVPSDHLLAVWGHILHFHRSTGGRGPISHMLAAHPCASTLADTSMKNHTGPRSTIA